MDLVTHSVLIISAVAVTLGLLYLRLWISQIERRDFMFFSLSCFVAAVYSWLEIAAMSTDSILTISSLLWWAQILAGLTIISVAIFLKTYLKSGRPWLFWSVICLCIAGLFINIVLPAQTAFREVTSINHVTFLNESLSVPVGVNGFSGVMILVSLIAFLMFCFDSAVAVWHRGERRKALVFGGGVAFFTSLVAMISIAIIWFPADTPLIAGPAVMFLVVAVGYELNYDIYRSTKSTAASKYDETDLGEIIDQLHLSAGTADVGAWIRSADGELIWASEKWYELFELDPSTAISC